jgi:predicted double-glycine peptidase
MKFRIINLIIIILLLYSCAGAGHIQKGSQTHLIKNVPFFPQLAYQCGPASLAGVLNFWGIYVTPDEVAEDIYSKSEKGTLDIDMVLYAQKKGLQAILYKGSIKDLRDNIDSGYPVIVLVDYGFWVYQQNHFIVVIGYNDDGVVVNSGKEKEKFISEKDFLKSWEKTNFWTLLIKPDE